jgi:hypothetical protein
MAKFSRILVTFPENPEKNDQKNRRDQEVMSLIDLFGSGFPGLGLEVDYSTKILGNFARYPLLRITTALGRKAIEPLNKLPTFHIFDTFT